MKMIDALERHFVASADPERAEQMAAYMRDQFPFYGIGAKERSRIQRIVWSEHPLPSDEDQLADLVEVLFVRGEREWHYTAVAALRRQGRHLTSRSWPTVRAVATTHAWWDTVDELAKHVAGRIVANEPPAVATMDQWVRSEDMWVARVALLHQLGFKEATDSKRLFAYCDLRAAEPDFFYRKAIGWALRQYAHTDPEAVQDYVESRTETLSALSRREALKNL